MLVCHCQGFFALGVKKLRIWRLRLVIFDFLAEWSAKVPGLMHGSGTGQVRAGLSLLRNWPHSINVRKTTESTRSGRSVRPLMLAPRSEQEVSMLTVSRGRAPCARNLAFSTSKEARCLGHVEQCRLDDSAGASVQRNLRMQRARITRFTESTRTIFPGRKSRKIPVMIAGNVFSPTYP